MRESASGHDCTTSASQSPFPENLLVARYLQGDRPAGEELAAMLLPLVQGVVRRVFGQQRSSDWEDATQTILLHILQKLSTWRAECPLRGWAAVVAARRALDLRSRRTFLPLEMDVAARIPSRSDAEISELSNQVRKAILGFPPDWRQVLEWEVEGVNHEEIAARLGRSRRTIQYWLEHMRNALLHCLEGD